ncbi:MAG TPA: hypothetical protein VJQ58_08915 [Burkholderiales bacterium]|nr:hypothetical protein [Burkholderiales bacterium]
MATLKRRISEGDFTPVLNWLERNGELRNGRVVIFDPDGNTVKPAQVECKRTYFAMCRLYAKVQRCPSWFRLLQLIRESRSRALDAAETVAEHCELDPECNARITLQAREWDCSGPKMGPWMVNAGHCFRIRCRRVH